MGGAAGHLSHIYENLSLTFGEIKEVLASAAEGNLEKVSEKLDGANLVFTWSGELKTARSGGEIKAGGLDAAGLAKKFFGRQNVEEIFSTAFKVLHQALSSLSDKELLKIFNDGRRWYSMEIIYASNPNTINYDSNNIVFHGWPIFEVQDDGSVEQSDHDEGVLALSRRIEQMQKAISMKDWQVRGPSLLRLKKLGDGSILQKALSQIDGAMSAGGVNDGDTVYDYLRNLFADDVKQLNLPEVAHKMTVERCATGKPSVIEIKRETPKELQAQVQAYVKASDSLKNQYIVPIEQAIHFFAIEVLRGLHSTLISRSDDEVMRLRNQLERAIRTIQASGNQAAMDVLQKEMARLGSIDNLNAAMEGIVFFYKGQAYKFTGSFAPAHQILALFKYGRKDIPKMDLGERQLRDALKHLIKEGGDAFGDIEPISLENFRYIWPNLEADLELLGLTDIEPIGSTGKKELMGDVDVAARFEGGADALFHAATQVFGADNVKRVGGNVVSIRYLMDVPAFQVDVMVGDPKFLRWSRYGTSTDPEHDEYSPVKGAVRNVLLNNVNSYLSTVDFPGKQTDLDRTRYTIDFDKGLFKVVQTKRSVVPGNAPLKGWKTLERKLVTDDPNKLVELVFGEGFSPEQLQTFENVVSAIKSSPRLRGAASQILSGFASDMKDVGAKTPAMLGDDPEATIAYINKVARG